MLVQQRFRTTELTDWYHRPDNFYVMNNILRQLIKKQTANMQSVFLLQEERRYLKCVFDNFPNGFRTILHLILCIDNWRVVNR